MSVGVKGAMGGTSMKHYGSVDIRHKVFCISAAVREYREQNELW